MRGVVSERTEATKLIGLNSLSDCVTRQLVQNFNPGYFYFHVKNHKPQFETRSQVKNTQSFAPFMSHPQEHNSHLELLKNESLKSTSLL